jgi:molybdopterin converting factor small subunit
MLSNVAHSVTFLNLSERGPELRTLAGAARPAEVAVGEQRQNAQEHLRVTVRFGATLRPASHIARETVLLDHGSRVRDLLDELALLHPELKASFNSALPIVAGTHVSQNTPLADGGEVSLLAPVAGG